MKVAVLGAAGGIGQALALLLKTQLPAGSELSLYDIAPVTPGVAVDLSHIPTAVKVQGFSGEDAKPALKGADVVLISAGVARKPGMDRADLFNVNAGIVSNLIEQVATTAPKALIGVITNPVNTTVAIAAEVLKNTASTIRIVSSVSLRWTSSVQTPSLRSLKVNNLAKLKCLSSVGIPV